MIRFRIKNRYFLRINQIKKSIELWRHAYSIQRLKHSIKRKKKTYIFFIVMNPTCPLSMSFYMLKIVGKKFQEKNGRSRKKDMNYE
jgi:hypothetical protein